MTRFSVTRGDSVTLAIAVTSSSLPVNLTGAVLYFTAKLRETDADADSVIAVSTTSGHVVTTDAAGGLAEVRLTPAITGALTPRTTLLWELRVKDASAQVFTLDSGQLFVEHQLKVTLP